MTTSPLANPTATRELLEEFGLATKHRLGQNFLVDNHVIDRLQMLEIIRRYLSFMVTTESLEKGSRESSKGRA